MPDALTSQRGPLHAIDDPTVRGELRKVWDRLDNHNFVTLDDFKALQRKVAGATTQTIKPGFVSTVIGDGTGSANSDLLTANNRWTGHNVWDRISVRDDPPARFQSLAGMPLYLNPSPPEGQILLDTGYTTLIDVRKSSDNGQEFASAGGNAAIYVQHRIDGNIATANNVNCGIRVQVETHQLSSAPINDAVAGYFSILPKGTNMGAFAVHADVYHRSLGNSITYGFDAEILRWSADGKVVGFHARAVSDGFQGIRHADAAFLASPGGSGSLGFLSVFQAGSDYTGGALQCQYGLDLALATCDIAAITLPPDKRVQLNGKSARNVGFYFDPIGKIQFFSDIGKTFSLGNDGTMKWDRPQTSGSASSPAGGVAMPNPMGYLVVNLGGFLRKFAFWDF